MKEEAVATGSGATLRLTTPAFTRDLACFVKRS
jgi:hypothetical protein